MAPSPVKNKLGRGRPKKRKINEVDGENASGPSGERLTADEALKKLITKEVKVQLERCDADNNVQEIPTPTSRAGGCPQMSHIEIRDLPYPPAAPLEAPASIDEPSNEQSNEPETVETVSPTNTIPQPVDQPRNAPTPPESPKTSVHPAKKRKRVATVIPRSRSKEEATCERRDVSPPKDNEPSSKDPESEIIATEEPPRVESELSKGLPALESELSKEPPFEQDFDSPSVILESPPLFDIPNAMPVPPEGSQPVYDKIFVRTSTPKRITEKPSGSCDIISNTDQSHQIVMQLVSNSELVPTEIVKKMLKTNGGPPPPTSEVNWYCSVMWDNKALEELIHHERADHKLYTQMGVGKLLVDRILGESESWPVIGRLRWQEPFILLDVISNQFEIVGGMASLLVQEKATAETRSPASSWNLLIPAECQPIGEEIARRFPAVPTTVVLWNAVKTVYNEPRTNGVCGEIFLPPRSHAGLTVLVFHHEILDKLRGRQMHLELPESELNHFQLNPYLRYGMYVDIDKIPTHLTLHAGYEARPGEPGDFQIDGYLMPVDGSDVESLDEVDIGQLSDKLTDEESWEGEEQWASELETTPQGMQRSQLITTSVPSLIRAVSAEKTPDRVIEQREIQSAGGVLQNGLDSQDVFLHTQVLEASQSQRGPDLNVSVDSESFVSCMGGSSQKAKSPGVVRSSAKAGQNTASKCPRKSLLSSFHETADEEEDVAPPQSMDMFEETSQQYRFTQDINLL